MHQLFGMEAIAVNVTCKKGLLVTAIPARRPTP